MKVLDPEAGARYGSKTYGIAFLLNDKMNTAAQPAPFKIHKDAVVPITETSIGKPWIMGQMGANKRHIAKEGVGSQMEALEWHRERSAGHIVDFIVNYDTGNTSVIIEIYPKYVDAVRGGAISRYVSPMISDFRQDENGELISGEIVHIHSVDWPGYEPEIAQFEGVCTGEYSSCKSNLATVAASGMTASMAVAELVHKLDHLKHTVAGCGCMAAAQFDESKHKRDDAGKFSKKEGGDSLPDTTYSKTSKSDKPFKAKVSKSPSGKTVYDISDMGFRPVEEDADFKKKFEAGIDPKWIKKDLNDMNGAGFLLDDGRWYGFNEAMHSVLVRFATDEANINIIAANSSELEKVGWVASMTGMIRIEARKKGTLHAKIFHPMTSAQRYELRDYILANEIDPERVVIELANTMKDRPERLIRRSVGAAGKFDESKHKRDDDGKFSKKEGMSADEPDSVTRSQATKSKPKFDKKKFDKLINYDYPLVTSRTFEYKVSEFETAIYDILEGDEPVSLNLDMFNDVEAYTSLGVDIEDLKKVFGDNPMLFSMGEPDLFRIITTRRMDLLYHFPKLKRYVELYDEVQKAMDIGYERRYEDAEYLYRGTELKELSSIDRQGLGGGGMFPYANFTTYYMQSVQFAMPHDEPIIIRVNKEDNRKYTTSPGYTLGAEGDSHTGEIAKPQGHDYYYEHEHRIRAPNNSDVQIEVMLRKHEDADDELKAMFEKRYPFVKKFHYGWWDN